MWSYSALAHQVEQTEPVLISHQAHEVFRQLLTPLLITWPPDKSLLQDLWWLKSRRLEATVQLIHLFEAMSHNARQKVLQDLSLRRELVSTSLKGQHSVLLKQCLSFPDTRLLGR